MITSLASTLRWTLSLGSKFARVVPFSTLFIIALTLVSQISMLVASLLPLKVVILLGSERIPSYFPSFLAAYGTNVLIALLGSIAIAFFLLHIFAERLINWRIAKATTRLLQMSHKMALFERQELTAQNAYLRFSRALASSVFIALVFIGWILFYPDMIVVHVSFALITMAILSSLHRLSISYRERLELQPAPILQLVAVVGFFIAFAFLIVDFIFFEPPLVLVAIISLLLSRQVMNRLSGIVVDFFLLQRERIKLDALFFHGKVFMPAVASDDKGIWSLLQDEMISQWVTSVLFEFQLNPENKEFTYRWQQVGVPNVAALEIRLGTAIYLFKLYETNRSALAEHEFTLLSANLKSLPALKFIGSTKVDKHNCLIYRLSDGLKPEVSEYKSVLWSFRVELIVTSVPASLVNHYQRSKPLLWQRVMALPLERLSLAANDEESKNLLGGLLERLPDICQLLSTLPVSVVNPNIGMDALWLQPDEKCVGLQWGLWSIEPIGAGWPEKEADFKKLEEFWSDIVKRRGDLSDVPLTEVKLASLIFALERDFNRQQFIQVLNLLPRIIECLEASKEESESEK